MSLTGRSFLLHVPLTVKTNFRRNKGRKWSDRVIKRRECITTIEREATDKVNENNRKGPQ